MSSTPTPTPTPSKAPAAPATVIVRIVTTGLIAMAGIGVGSYLMLNGQPAAGSFALGVVLTHYFTGANGQTATDNVMTAVQAVGALFAPPKQGG